MSAGGQGGLYDAEGGVGFSVWGNHVDPGLWCEDVVVSVCGGALCNQLMDAVRVSDALRPWCWASFVFFPLSIDFMAAVRREPWRIGGQGGHKERPWLVVAVAEVGAPGKCWSSGCVGQTLQCRRCSEGAVAACSLLDFGEAMSCLNRLNPRPPFIAWSRVGLAVLVAENA